MPLFPSKMHLFKVLLNHDMFLTVFCLVAVKISRDCVSKKTYVIAEITKKDTSCDKLDSSLKVGPLKELLV